MESGSDQVAEDQRIPAPATPLGRAFKKLRPVTCVEDAAIPEGPALGTAWTRDRSLLVALVLTDLFAVAAAPLIALQWFGDSGVDRYAFIVVPFVPLVCKTAGLYDRDRHLLRKTTLEEVPQLFQAAALYTLVFWLVDSVFVARNVTPREVAVTWLLLFLLLVLGRASTRRIVAQRVEPERCLVLGDAASATFLRDRIERLGGGHGIVIGRVPLLPDSDNGLPVLGDFEALGLVLAAHDVDRVIVAPSNSNFETTLEGIRMVKSLGCKVTVFPRLFEVLGSSVEFDNVAGVTLLGVREYGLPRSSYYLKRAMDLTVTGIGTLVLLPLLVSAAIAIKLDSRGPLFYRQRRIGRDGREFQMLKFRTMAVDADLRKHEVLGLNQTEGLFKLADDPRVTRVGRILRRISLDEMPQLLNVLKGDMSLVGPRPLVPEEDEKVEGWQRRRLHVPPGMTGHWQILGNTRVPLNEMVKIDYLYGANWSLWGDVKTIIRTLPHVIGRKGM